MACSNCPTTTPITSSTRRASWCARKRRRRSDSALEVVDAAQPQDPCELVEGRHGLARQARVGEVVAGQPVVVVPPHPLLQLGAEGVVPDGEPPATRPPGT